MHALHWAHVIVATGIICFMSNLQVCLRTGGVQKPQKKNLIEDPKGTLGISDQFGFTKKNEVCSTDRASVPKFAPALI